MIPAVPACALALLTGACFVNEGDCVTSGVDVEPCAVPAKFGQTRKLTAVVTGDPSQAVKWSTDVAAMQAFDLDNSVPGRLQLISTLGVAGTYRFRAESTVDSTQFGEAVVTVGAYSFGYPPPPIQINGADGPLNYQAAVAAGGDRYYVAYADVVDQQAALGGGSTVSAFVRQFDAASNRVLTEVADVFEFFDPNPFDPFNEPNLAADAQGTGYWVDFGLAGVGLGDTIHPRIRRLTRDGTEPEVQELFDFCDAGPMAVAPDGTLYFFGRKFETDCDQRLYRVRPFGASPVALEIDTLPDADRTYDSLAADPEGRLLLAAEADEADSRSTAINTTIVRVLPDPLQTTLLLDPTFSLEDTDFFSAGAIAVDAQGIIYAVAQGHCDSACDDDCDPKICNPNAFRDCILLIDSRGRFVREMNEAVRVECYGYPCPPGCADFRCSLPVDDPDRLVPFDSIRSIAATPDGRLRIVDDVNLGLAGDDPCQVQVRIVLIDP